MSLILSHNKLIQHVLADSVYNLWNFMLYIVLALSLDGEEPLLKNCWIRIRIFTKIELIPPCYTPNLPTKFRLNPSTTFWDILLYVIFGPLSQLWTITLKILRSRSGFGTSAKCNRFILVTHPSSPQNFVQICLQLFEVFCSQTIKDTNRQGWNITSIHLR